MGRKICKRPGSGFHRPRYIASVSPEEKMATEKASVSLEDFFTSKAGVDMRKEIEARPANTNERTQHQIHLCSAHTPFDQLAQHAIGGFVRVEPQKDTPDLCTYC